MAFLAGRPLFFVFGTSLVAFGTVFRDFGTDSGVFGTVFRDFGTDSGVFGTDSTGWLHQKNIPVPVL